MRTRHLLTTKVKSYLRESRVARLATINKDLMPHIVPFVFANDSSNIYFVIDRKTKHEKLRRVENIERTGIATLLADKYSEDWEKLSFVMIRANANIVTNLSEKRRAARLLKQKYPQYSKGGYFPDRVEDATFVKLSPVRIAQWSQKLRKSVI